MESNLSSWEKGEFFLKEEPVLLQWRELVWKLCCQSSIALLSSPARRQYCLADCISYWKNDSGDIDGQLAHRSHNLRHTDSRTKTTYNANHLSPDSKLLKARWFTFTFALVQFPFPTPYVTTDAKNVRKMQVSCKRPLQRIFFRRMRLNWSKMWAMTKDTHKYISCFCQINQLFKEG